MTCNLLKLNQDKTEFIMTETHQQLNKTQGPSIDNGEEKVRPVKAVRNLGFHFDSQLKNKSHIDKLCQSVYLSIRGISSMRNHFMTDSCKSLMQTLVHS